MRAILLIAWMNPAIITGAVFKWLMATDVGIFNFLLVHLGIVAEPVNFLASSQTALGSVIFGNIWVGVPFNMILLLSGLQGIDGDLYESAVIDGANILQRIWHIDIPTILPTMIILLIMSLGNVMNVGYEKVYLMQNDLIADVSEIISTYVYKIGLVNNQFSFSTAIGQD